MTAIQSLSDLVNRMTGGNNGNPENIFFFKNFTVGGVADTWTVGVFYSFWRYDGIPGGGTVPGAVAVPTNTTAGALPVTNPGGAREKWLVQAVVSTDPDSMAGLLVYDRLLHVSGLNATLTTAQTVGGTLTRGLGYVGNQIYWECYTGIGTTVRTLNVSYTNESNVAGRTGTATIGGTSGTQYNEVNSMSPIMLQAGDKGVKSVESVTLSGTTGTAGDFGITIARPICWLPTGSGSPGRDFTVGPMGMPKIETNACLALAGMVISATEVPFQGMVATVEA